VGGPPPDDSEGDWVMNVVHSVSPQSAFVRSINPAGLGHWVFFADVNGGGLVPATAGDVTVVGNQLIALRRAPAATFVQLRTSDFAQARFVASDHWNGYLGLVFSIEGVGMAELAPDASHELSSLDGHSVVVLIGQDASLRWVNQPGLHALASVALLDDGGVTVTGSTESEVLVDDVVHWQVPDSNLSDAYMVRYDPAGRPSWVGIVATPDYRTGDAKVARAMLGEAVMTFPFRGTATVSFPEGAIAIEASSPNTTYGVLRVSQAGEVVASLVPLRPDFDPAPGNLSARAPAAYLTDDGVILSVDARITRQGAEGVISAPGFSFARVTWQGELQWARSSEATLFGEVGPDGVVAIAWSGDHAPFRLFDEGDHELYVAASAASVFSLFGLDIDGRLEWAVEYPPASPALPVAVRASDDGRVLVGGAFTGTDSRVHPTSPALQLSGAGDLNAWAGLFNSANGLSCTNAQP